MKIEKIQRKTQQNYERINRKQYKEALKLCFSEIKKAIRNGESYAYLYKSRYYNFSDKCICDVIKTLKDMKLIVSDYEERSHKTYFKISW